MSNDTSTENVEHLSEEQKALTSPDGLLVKVPSSREVLCSCVKGVRQFIPSLKRGDAADFFPNSEPFEGVAVIMWFPPSEPYPEGTKHLAYVAKIEGDKALIYHTNKSECKFTQEWLSLDSPEIIGYYNAFLDIDLTK